MTGAAPRESELSYLACLKNFRTFWRGAFDVRPGEYAATALMALYLLFVLFAYYILKPVSRALFLNNFQIDQLPFLYILIAAAGGVLAYLYTRLAVVTSLVTAVRWATGASIGSLVLIWWLIGSNPGWMHYVFNIWVSLFGIVLVSQGWLVASNLFDSRQARRLYGLISLGALLGGALGGSFTAATVKKIGTEDLLLVSAVAVALSYLAFHLLAQGAKGSLAGARAAEVDETEFGFVEIVSSVRRYRHLQIIVGIITLTYMSDVLIDFQFSAMAKHAHSGDNLTAFLGGFYGLYLNLFTFALQVLLTSFVVSRFGIGGILQIMPVSLALGSIGTLLAPGVWTTGIMRLIEASSRYSFNRTGMELLYLPLPAALRNRTKVFVDIFVDRMARGLGGLLLVFLAPIADLHPRWVSLLVIGFAVCWSVLANRARYEYVLTVRKKLQSRRLDLERARTTVGEPVMMQLLEKTALEGTARQARYALSLLNETKDYPLESLLERVAERSLDEVRATAYDLARASDFPGLLHRARQEMDSGSAAVAAASAYVVALSPLTPEAIRECLNESGCEIAEGAVLALGTKPELARQILTCEWFTQAIESPDPQRRRLAALAIAAHGDQSTPQLHRLLGDTDVGVVEAACRAAGKLRNRAYVHALIENLGEARLRGAAIEGLAPYGSDICGTLGDILEDDSVTATVRRQAPRVLRRIGGQRSVNALVQSLDTPELSVRAAVLKALHQLREIEPHLDFGHQFVQRQILSEARHYFELSATLSPLTGERQGRRGHRVARAYAGGASETDH